MWILIVSLLSPFVCPPELHGTCWTDCFTGPDPQPQPMRLECFGDLDSDGDQDLKDWAIWSNQDFVFPPKG